MKNQEEIWKDVVGYEGLYKISSLGRIKSLNFKTFVGRDANGVFIRKVHEHIMKPQISKSGYSKIVLKKDGKNFNTSIHRIVSIAFIENKNSLPFVNHINEIKCDNSVSNLEWCTHLYNCNHGTRSARQKQSMINNKKLSIQVIKMTKDMIEIETYPSISEAGRQNNIRIQGICGCINGTKSFHSAGGFKWKKL